MYELMKFQIRQLKRALEHNTFRDAYYIIFSDYPSEWLVMDLIKYAGTDLELKKRLTSELKNLLTNH